MRVFAYDCGRCGRDYRGLEPAGGYGQVVFRSGSGAHLAGLDAVGDTLFDRVRQAVQAHPAAPIEHDRRTGRVVRRVLARLSDPAPDGSRYDLDGRPACPHCGGTTPAHWSSVEPPEVVEVEVPPLTRTAWEALPHDEQQRVLAEEVDDAWSAS